MKFQLKFILNKFRIFYNKLFIKFYNAFVNRLFRYKFRLYFDKYEFYFYIKYLFSDFDIIFENDFNDFLLNNSQLRLCSFNDPFIFVIFIKKSH